MRIGSLRKPFVLQKAGLSSGDANAHWTYVTTLWGRMELASEEMRVRELSRRVSHSVTVRARRDIDLKSGMRLVYGGRSFMIRQVLCIDGTAGWTKLLVEETLPID